MPTTETSELPLVERVERASVLLAYPKMLDVAKMSAGTAGHKIGDSATA